MLSIRDGPCVCPSKTANPRDNFALPFDTPWKGRTSSFFNVVDSEWGHDSTEYGLQEIDRLVANANAGKCQIMLNPPCLLLCFGNSVISK